MTREEIIIAHWDDVKAAGTNEDFVAAIERLVADLEAAAPGTVAA